MPSGAKVVLLVVVEAFGSSIHTLAWQPWEHMKQLWQWMHPGQHHHFLHHEAARWTKAHVAGREALGEEFEMRGVVASGSCVLLLRGEHLCGNFCDMKEVALPMGVRMEC